MNMCMQNMYAEHYDKQSQNEITFKIFALNYVFICVSTHSMVVWSSTPVTGMP